MTGYYIRGRLRDHKKVGPMTWAPTHTIAKQQVERMVRLPNVEKVIIIADNDSSDIGEVYHETPAVEALMDDFDTRAALYDEEVEGAWSTLRRHKLARLDLGDAATFAVAEVLRKLEEEIAWLKHQNGLD